MLILVSDIFTDNNCLILSVVDKIKIILNENNDIQKLQ